MNSLIETLNRFSNDALPIAWQLCWQSSLLIVVVGSLALLLRKRLRASGRYALWLVVLIKLLLPPTLALPTGVAWWVRPNDAPVNIAPLRQMIVSYPAESFPQLPPPIRQEPLTPPPPRLTIQAWSIIGVASVSVALLIYLVFRWIQISRIVRRASEPSESVSATLREARKRVQHPGSAAFQAASCSKNDLETTRLEDGCPRIRITREKMSPAVCGLFHPVILLPESLAEKLSSSQLRAVLMHELIHLKRGDVWINCLQALLQIVYWWNPLVWFANSRIRRVREEAVDDAVMLALRDDAQTYAPTLLEVAKLAFHRPLASLGLVGILESRSALRQRIERLINFKTPRRAGLSLVSIVGIAAFTAIAVPMGEAPAKSSKPAQVVEASATSTQTPAASPTSTNSHATLITANAITFDAKTRELVAQGNVHVETEGSQLTADKLTLSPSGAMVASAKSPLDGVLAFDKELQETNVNTGEVEAHFKFSVTNVSSFAVTITNIQTSCGCTVAKMPASLWPLAPGASGEIPVTMNVAGKSGVVTKTVSVMSDRATKILTVKATISGTAASSQEEANVIHTSAPRQAILNKLKSIQLRSVSFDKTPLSEVIRKLSEDVKQLDPEHSGINFLIRNEQLTEAAPAIDPATGLPVVRNNSLANENISTAKVTINPPLNNLRLGDVLDAILKSSEQPIKYSILDYGIAFSAKGKEVQPLVARRFKIDPETFVQNIERETGIHIGVPKRRPVAVTNSQGQSFVAFAPGTAGSNELMKVQSAFISILHSHGVDLSPPKSVFFNDGRGELYVRATSQDLGAVEQVVLALNYAPPQINIRVKFLEMPKDFADTLFPSGAATNSYGVIGILTAPAMKQLMDRLRLAPSVNEISDGNITTLSGRQTQFQSVDLTNAVVGILNGIPKTKRISVGPTLDVIPLVGGDGHTVKMTLVPAFTEFLGYETPEIADANRQPKPLPHLRIRQVKTSATIWDGQTVVLGRLPQTEVLLGQTTTPAWATAEDPKRTFVVLVTATLIDFAGNRIHTDE